jgi:outer membrane usher protein
MAALLLAAGTAHGAAPPAPPPTDLATRFRTAPATLPAQTLTASIWVNGVRQGEARITVSAGRITIPNAALPRLRLAGLASDALELTPDGPIAYTWEPAMSRLRITVPATALQPLRLDVDPDPTDPALTLSPEATGLWVDYDANLRHGFAWGPRQDAHSAASAQGGVFANVHLSARDLLIGAAWSYDSERIGAPLVRLDSAITWRPASLAFAATIGDVTDRSGGQARPFRFLGLEAGTDHSAEPGFTPVPVPQLAGSAAAGSTIDAYIDSQRVAGTQTAGGAFNLLLPANDALAGARIVVTDVTGRQSVLSVQPPVVNAQTIRGGLLLWSAGVGVPRFGFGLVSDSYAGGVFGQANLRYGLTDRLTLTAHDEAGSRLEEAEAGANLQATPWLGVRGNLGGSLSRLGAGAFASASMVAAVSARWFINASLTQGSAAMADAVAISGIAYMPRQNRHAALVLPPRSMAELAVSWQLARDFSASLVATRYVYAGTGPAGFAAAAVQGNLFGQHVYCSLTRALGHHADTTLLAGVTMLFGRTAVSGGAGWEPAGSGGGGPSGTIGISHSMQDGVGSLGWQAEASHAAGETAGTASLATRTGFGMPGLQVIAGPGSLTAYATAAGSAGIAAGHAFAADPVQGGIVVVDAGAPGVPVTNNGFPEGRSGADGKLAVPVPVAGAPQTIAVSAAGLPLDMVAAETEKAALVRGSGIAVLRFGVQSAAAGATVIVTVGGKPPAAGSVLAGSGASAPVDARGRAYMPRLQNGERLLLTLPDGTSCTVATQFDGHGGPARRLGPIPCLDGGT